MCARILNFIYVFTLTLKLLNSCTTFVNFNCFKVSKMHVKLFVDRNLYQHEHVVFQSRDVLPHLGERGHLHSGRLREGPPPHRECSNII